MSTDLSLPDKLLELALERQRKCEELLPLAAGTTIHAIEKATSFGPARPLVGYLLVEREDGTLSRVTGAELSLLNERYPNFLKNWRLESQ